MYSRRSYSAPVSFLYWHPVLGGSACLSTNPLGAMLRFRWDPQVATLGQQHGTTVPQGSPDPYAVQVNQDKGMSSLWLASKVAFLYQQYVYIGIIASINNSAVSTRSKDSHKNWLCCILDAFHTL